MAKVGNHERVVEMVRSEMNGVIKSFSEQDFMGRSPKVEKRRELLSTAAPDIQQMLADGMPMYMAERLVKLDQE